MASSSTGPSATGRRRRAARATREKRALPAPGLRPAVSAPAFVYPQGFAAAREAEAGAKGNSTLVAVLAAAVAILSGSLVALVVVHLRGRKTADAAEVPYVAAKDGNCDV